MAYHFHDLSPYVLIGNPLTLTVIEFFAVPGALLGTALYPLGLDAPVWLYVGAGIRFILWVGADHRRGAGIDAASARLRAVRAAVPQPRRAQRDALADLDLPRAWRFPSPRSASSARSSGPRYDVIVAPSGDLAAVRDADGKLQVVGKRFNAFAAEQWLAADGDGRDPATARDPDAPCDRVGCVADLPEGQSLSLVLDRAAFEEDCARAEVVVSPLTAPADCAALTFDERRLATTGAVGLDWDGTRFVVAADRARAGGSPVVAGAQAAARRAGGAAGPADEQGRRPGRSRRRSAGIAAEFRLPRWRRGSALPTCKNEFGKRRQAGSHRRRAGRKGLRHASANRDRLSAL